MTVGKGGIAIKGKVVVYLLSGFLIIFLAFLLKNAEEIKEMTEYKGIDVVSFQDDTFEINLKKAKGMEIYYTTDGSDPQKGEENTSLYQEPIPLLANEEESVVVYKFKAYFDDDKESEVTTRTFFVGEQINERYDTLVLSISAPEESLFGHENGIFVEGKLREDWIRENPEAEVVFDAPANYNLRGRESEREVYLEVFEPDGTRVMSQYAGLRISGNFTRQSEQKSMQIFARKEYDGKGKFKYVFFEDLCDETGSVIDQFEKLKIRNTGNDRSEGFIRDELAMTLAADAGFQDVQAVRPISVYINGRYHGLYWLHSTYDDEYFKQKYGAYDGEMVVIGRSDTYMEDEESFEEDYGTLYNEKYQEFSAMDLTVDENARQLNQFIDIENYLKYFAIEIYLSNRDWPYNNVQAYRYVSPNGMYEQGTVFDGRYRFLLYDLDTTMGLGSTLGEESSFELFTFMEHRQYSPLFSKLMAREDCREFFMNYVIELADGAFSSDNVSARLDELHSKRENEMQAYIDESIINQNLLEISPLYLQMHMDWILQWAMKTEVLLVEQLETLWGTEP